jgi:subtilisin family serine protease
MIHGTFERHRANRDVVFLRMPCPKVDLRLAVRAPRWACALRRAIAAISVAGVAPFGAFEASLEATLEATSAAAPPPLLAGDGGDPAPVRIRGVDSASGHLMIQLAPGVSPVVDAKGEPALRKPGRARAERDSRAAFAAAGVANLEPVIIGVAKDAALAKKLGLDRWHRAELAPNADVVQAHARLARLAGLVSRVEYDGAGGVAEIPNDASFGLQWNMLNTGQSVFGLAGTPGADVGVTAAWNVTHGDPNLVIAVLDSGIDPHPQLAGRILPGINVPDNSTITADECNGHGTHVSGILAAAGNDGIGVAGMTWNTKLLPVVVVNGCSGFESNVASGLIWAVDQGAKIVNMSLQFYGFGTPLREAVAYADAQGALMFAATGNNGNTNMAAPARWSQTIAVASTNNGDVRAPNSNYGPETDVCAPGVSVYSLAPGGLYSYKSGTSMASPHVAGLAALIWSARPALTAAEVRAFIEQGAQDLGTPGRDDFHGFGRIDAEASFSLLPPLNPGDINGDGVVDSADLGILLSAWGPCGNCDSCPGDVDGNCQVDSADLGILLSNW